MRKLAWIGVLALAGCILHERTRTLPGVTAEYISLLHLRGSSESTLLRTIDAYGVSRTISPEEVSMLKRDGVSDRVIDAMIAARPQPQVVTYYHYTPPLWYYGPWVLFSWGGHWIWHHGHGWHGGIHWRVRP